MLGHNFGLLCGAAASDFLTYNSGPDDYFTTKLMITLQIILMITSSRFVANFTHYLIVDMWGHIDYCGKFFLGELYVTYGEFPGYSPLASLVTPKRS